MGKTRAAYPPEFRRQMVELVRAGRSPEELARECARRGGRMAPPGVEPKNARNRRIT